MLDILARTLMIATRTGSDMPSGREERHAMRLREAAARQVTAADAVTEPQG